MKERKEINEKYKWDLSDYCSNDEEFIKELNCLKTEIKKIKKFEGLLTENNEKEILKCLNLKTTLTEKIYRLAYYAMFRNDEDLTNGKGQELISLISSLDTDFSNLTTFIIVDLNELSHEYITYLLNNDKFKDYHRFFENIIRNKPHMLSRKEEILLSKMEEFAGESSTIYHNLCDAELTFNDVLDSKGKKYKLTISTSSKYKESSDRELRKNATHELNMGFGKFNTTIASIYANYIKELNFDSEVRKFNNSLEMSFFYEETSLDVYNSLKTLVNNNLDILRDMFKLKQKTLNLESFYIYDFFAPISKKFSLKLDFYDAVNLVKKSLYPLGEEYVKFVDKAVQERWFDVYENKGKQSGAYSATHYRLKPKILMNYTSSASDVFTITHEFGHCMHSYYSNLAQPFTTSNYEIFVAEVASTVNEVLLLKYLISNAKSKDEKIFYINQFLIDMIYSTIFRQTAFAEFEESAHKFYKDNKFISKDILNNIYLDILKKYFSESVILLPSSQFEWCRLSHLFKHFYVYKYATGMISALMIANGLTSQNEEIRNKFFNGYMKFLHAGSSLPPLEILKLAGVDLEKPEVMQEAFNIARNMLNEWENLLK